MRVVCSSAELCTCCLCYDGTVTANDTKCGTESPNEYLSIKIPGVIK